MKDLFLSNQSSIKFLNQLKEELNNCQRFYISVSFIKIAGMKLIENEMESALDRGAEGYLITSTYQNFTDIPSLRLFLRWSKKYPKFHVHLDFECFGPSGYHSKGYLFESKNSNSILVGSSNITRFALLFNVEWNILLQDEKNINTFIMAKKEFDELYNKTLELSDDLIKQYQKNQEYALVKWDMDYSFDQDQFIKPNLMQRKALKELMRNRSLGVNKSLIIAATGSGKTYLAALDAKNFGAKRLLFVVHRETILSDARNTFENIFKVSRSYGFYTGNKKETNTDFIFATSIMISKHLEEFDPREFDYIIFDEVHHIVAECGMKIFSYFHPEFLLGLTATPERMDNQDIFALFDNNVSFEMRLKDALINNLVVPFHYYGIRDEFADYSAQNKTIISKEITGKENVSFITSQIEKYRKKDEKLKCIAFCTSIQHAMSMSEELNKNGFNSAYLYGANDTGARIKAFNSLQDDDDPLEIICCVDILNEGVDIPQVNMILFLRPTESATIFLQQLGRGLRKAPNKEYCTVLDFIGNNYKRSTQIAFALGTLTKSPFVDQYTLKTMIRTDFQSLGIPNLKIFFDDLSKKEIVHYLDEVNFYKSDVLKQDYLNFKKYLRCDTYPKHIDYLNSEIAPDLIKFLKANMSGVNYSYYSFLRKIKEETLPIFDDEHIKFIDNLSKFLPLVRLDEYIIIKNMINGITDIDSLIGYDCHVNESTLNHALHILTKKGLINNNELSVNIESDIYRDFILDILDYGINRYINEFGNYDGKFKIMNNYYKEQVMMILLEDSLLYISGTKFDEKTKEAFLFVNLYKNLRDRENRNYKDKFLNGHTFQWESEGNVTADNVTGKTIANTQTVHLFIRKMDKYHGITMPLTYFGTGKFTNTRASSNTGKPTLLLDVILDHEVASEYYDDFEIPSKVEKDL
jgi:superfamily II DNA or RNA helicase